MDPSELAEAARQIQKKSQAGNAAQDSLFMGMSMGGLMANLLFSLIGFFYFKYGRSTGSVPAMATGLALMLYPYFISNTLYMVLTGLAIMLAHWLFGRQN